MNYELQDAVTLAEDLRRLAKVDLATDISVTTVEADAAFAEFERLRLVGTIAEYHEAERRLNEVRARLAELERQAGK